MERRRIVWAFGGGKGGVGKSLVCSAVATELARSGRRVVLLDADLGAANLHTLLGVVHPSATLDDFWSGRVANLEQQTRLIQLIEPSRLIESLELKGLTELVV